jgi:hypothetical protein
METALCGHERLQLGEPSLEEKRISYGKSWEGNEMLSPELYGLLLTVAVLVIVVCILAFERYKMKTKLPTRQIMKICTAEPAGIEADSIKKGGSQGI